ncbi:hypothetical protein C5167_002009 [Papaver somniferum]|uniref:Uncharacterized protein n=1 Tax=Papaver somniferum TaxID=3469 RepID=A0A4Y7KUY4_PAPSO|nr:hypothetical protein C5167_002009 [Papaver somniferum]
MCRTHEQSSDAIQFVFNFAGQSTAAASPNTLHSCLISPVPLHNIKPTPASVDSALNMIQHSMIVLVKDSIPATAQGLLHHTSWQHCPALH